MSDALSSLREQHLYRQHRVVDGPQGPELEIQGRRLLNFCSNDYLGLAAHPEVRRAFQKGVDDHGVGSGAAHLICGHSRAHQALEEDLAEFTGRPRALLFSTGYMANLGVMDALLGRRDLVFEDRLNHASLLDGARLSRAKLRRYPHQDVETLSAWLQAGFPGRRLIATDGVFSMDGDLAPLPDLARLAEEHGAWLMVDDAHGLGVLGRDGGGTLAHFGLGVEAVPILMGTLGKAFGTFGAFVAGSETLIETLIQSARPYIYTTAPPAALAVATRASLALARREGWRRERLRTLVERFRRGATELGFRLDPSTTPIQPLIAGTAARALAWSRHLEEQGILVAAIRPPTVPEGSARLRLTLTAAHSDAHLARLLDALGDLPGVDAP